jgi:hypothetical protein
MGVKFNERFTGETNMTVVDISIPPFRGAVFKFAK